VRVSVTGKFLKTFWANYGERFRRARSQATILAERGNGAEYDTIFIGTRKPRPNECVPLAAPRQQR
jgi:hypothetical protein